MRILFLGDVVGRDARDKITTHLPRLREERALDAIIVNGDNAAGGFGVTGDICDRWLRAGADVVTGGDHIWDQKDIPAYISQEKRLLRPHNFPEKTPGSGIGLFELTNGKKLLVLHVLGQVFHREHLDCPFAAVEKALADHALGRTADAIFVDFHAEATSEKTAMGHFLDGRVSAVIGSHTHVPTSDARILKHGTAYQTDAGMCGDYDSIIGFEVAAPLERFLTKRKKPRLQPARSEATLHGTIVETEQETGLASSIEAITL